MLLYFVAYLQVPNLFTKIEVLNEYMVKDGLQGNVWNKY